MLAKVFSAEGGSVGGEAVGEGKAVFTVESEFEAWGAEEDGILGLWAVGEGSFLLLCEEGVGEKAIDGGDG